jgi:hypothetical protein
MTVLLIDEIFSQDDIDIIYKSVSSAESVVDSRLGRLQTTIENCLSYKTIDKLEGIVQNFTKTKLEIRGVIYVEYNKLYGVPNLPPHVDADSTDILINIQLESNTQWDLGLNLETYSLKDNCALIFNPNENIHWRVHKEFNDGEYVKMLFVRLYKIGNSSDYSYLPNHPDHEMFKPVRAFRDSLKSNGI